MPNQQIESFRTGVIDRFRCAPPGRSALSYAEYMLLPEPLRAGDEADAVDHQFSTRVLDWLGFGAPPCNVQHNRARVGGIPDHVVEVHGLPVLVWEDKKTTEKFVSSHELQLLRYAEGRVSYAVWTNARRLIAFRVEPTGTLVRLVDVDIAAVFGLQLPLQAVLDDVDTKLAYLRLLLSAQRFIEFDQLANSIAVDENTFLQTAIPLVGPQALESFLGAARAVLEGLRLAALAAFNDGRQSVSENRATQVQVIEQWGAAADRYLAGLGPLANTGIETIVSQVRHQLGTFGDADLGATLAALPRRGAVAAATRAFSADTLRANGALLSMRLAVYPSQRILDAYRVWVEQQSEEENAIPEIYAQQVAYVFFVRVFLARILEDKGIIRPRIASNGGFLLWRQLLSTSDIQGQAYVDLMSRRVGAFYQHFYRQPVFDWFVPDDYLLLLTLNLLARWRLDTIDSDVLGFTYENYLDRVLRNKKGHFLTRPEVVEYILDLLGYSGHEVIGRSLIDPACGSGSFLVHAARRYRAVLARAFTPSDGPIDDVRLARQFVSDVARLYVGLDIEPFAAYLAELNLLIQLLDDIQVLMQAGEAAFLDRFQIFRTDSLDLPDFVLAGLAARDQAQFESELDEAFAVKALQGPFAPGFSYVVANPPYINPKQHQPAARHSTAPFFSQYLPGDTNTYLMFLRLGTYLLGQGGRLAMIVPLTLLGDQSASAVRHLLCTPPFGPTAIVRFYTGNVLFRGVDQATCIVTIGSPAPRMTVGGATTIHEARASQRTVRSRHVISATPPDPPWGKSFLVSPDGLPYAVWSHVRRRCCCRLNDLMQKAVEPRQGDFNATHVNPCRIGAPTGQSRCLPIYKGQNLSRYAPLPATPSDWAIPNPSGSLTAAQQAARRAVEALLNVARPEVGIALRETARLNTRRRLIATWFERGPYATFGFSHEVWRMIARPGRDKEALALLALLNSAMIAYLYNLFSTNNHVVLGDLERVLTPDIGSLDTHSLCDLTRHALDRYAEFHSSYALVYGAEVTDGTSVAVDASLVLASSRLPRLTVGDLVRRGEVQTSRLDSPIRTLLSAGELRFTSGLPAEAYLRLLDPWAARTLRDVMDSIEVPDVGAAASFVQLLSKTEGEAQAALDRFLQAERAIDEFVFDWYQVRPSWRSRISEGLPWAR